MYGVLHKSLFTWINSLPDGEEKMDLLLELVGKNHLDDFFRYYDEGVTQQLLSAIQEVLGVNLDECKYQAGLMFMDAIADTGLHAILKALGDDLFSVIANIDSLHESFRPSFPHMKSPAFKPERVNESTMAVHYFSEHDDLSAFVMGVIKACATSLFQIEIEVSHRVKKGSNGSNHDVFHVFSDENIFPPEQSAEHVGFSKYSTLTLPHTLTDSLLPFHFVVNRDSEIISCGSELSSRLQRKEVLGTLAKDTFTVVRPLYTKLSFDDIMDHIDEPFILVVSSKKLEEVSQMTVLSANLEGAVDSVQHQAQNNMSRTSSVSSSVYSSGAGMEKVSRLAQKSTNLTLHGQMTYYESMDAIIFAGIPLLRTLDDMNGVGVHLHSMPLHSHGRDIVFSALLQSAAANNVNKVEAKLAELDNTMAQVENKSEQVDQLLSSILPPRVAESLAQGKNPVPEFYPKVSLLYSDIAGFTNISSNLPPSEVVEMLHTLFLKFDDLAERHGCYKVETIGDAYVVSAGCPEECDDHALRLANFAIDMLHTVSTVKSPVDGEPLRIRVGLHSGTAVAGVVGRVRPRYCLFGDIVTNSEAMESNGIPCCIQASYRFIESLPVDHPLQVVPRGHIPVKNKGHMKTFLILGNSEWDYPPLLPSPAQVEDIGPHLMDMARAKSDTSRDRIAAIQTSKTRQRRNIAAVV